MHYNWYRHYDPTIGRFTQPDPLGFVDGPSVYAYGRSSPARFVDFDGLSPSTAIGWSIDRMRRPGQSNQSTSPQDRATVQKCICPPGDKCNSGKIPQAGGGGGSVSLPKWPGNDGKVAPPETVWRGRPGSEPGSADGNYYNPRTQESYRPDLNHPDPLGPHWDYRDAAGKWYRIFPNGSVIAK